MEWFKVRGLISGLFGRDDPAAALSRREMLAGIGLVGLLATAPKLLVSSPAEARTVDALSAKPDDSADTTQTSEDRSAERKDENTTDVTELSAQRRRYWRRRYRWRRRYWRRRYHWRRRYWRRRRWYRRYW